MSARVYDGNENSIDQVIRCHHAGVKQRQAKTGFHLPSCENAYERLSLAPAGANVVMAALRLPMVTGVAESRVETGALTKHPIKGAPRTITLAYILVALLGQTTRSAPA